MAFGIDVKLTAQLLSELCTGRAGSVHLTDVLH